VRQVPLTSLPRSGGGLRRANDTIDRKRWRFHHWTWRGNTLIDDYREFDANKLTWMGDSAQTFTYDHLDRLTHAQATGGPAPYNRTYAYDKIGNITHKDGMGDYFYNDPNHVHAVTHIGTQQRYWYDANGNMTQRIESGKTYVQGFNAENKLQTVTEGGQTTTFTYDGDGNRVKKEDPSGTTYYVGGYYEVQGSTVTKYYYAGTQRVAMRQGGAVTYLHGDHLGSTSLVTNDTGGFVARVLYYPYGETRYEEGTLPTDYQFTGQRKEGFGLYDYRARFYDASLGRFISADTIVPDLSSQSHNRYMYVNGNPLKYVDPSGHKLAPPDPPPPKTKILEELLDNLVVTVASDSDLEAVHQQQGVGTNDCGPTSLAMVTNLVLRQQGIVHDPVKGKELGDIMLDYSYAPYLKSYRVAGVLSHKLGVEGATPPWGMVDAFNDLNQGLMDAGGPDLGAAKWSGGRTKQDLIDNMSQGYPTAIMLTWDPAPYGIPASGAHWVVVAGYNRETDEFLILDPGYGLEPVYDNAPVGLGWRSWESIDEDWSRPILTMHNVMVTFKPVQSD
jgi:RHS repeat-associated protein